jgi:hypothetical protein
MEESSDLCGDNLVARTEFDGDFRAGLGSEFHEEKTSRKNCPGIFSRKVKIVPALKF